MARELPAWSDREILAARPPRKSLDANRPYAWLVEEEINPAGEVDRAATVFLTHAECAFRCLMCDLWKNTLSVPTPEGATPRQIRYALARLGPAERLKLYNSGNFFDPRALPENDYREVAELCRGFTQVTVENHPRMCGERMLRFRDALAGPDLEVAMGLETVHRPTLARLNKQMTLEDFAGAANRLRRENIGLRVFVLVRPPGMGELEGVDWAVRSVEFAFDQGAQFCALIPTRGGNGAIERLAEAGLFQPPSLSSLESALHAALRLPRRRAVTVDTWDLESLADCPRCGRARVERLRDMNLAQRLLPAIECECGGSAE